MQIGYENIENEVKFFFNREEYLKSFCSTIKKQPKYSIGQKVFYICNGINFSIITGISFKSSTYFYSFYEHYGYSCEEKDVFSSECKIPKKLLKNGINNYPIDNNITDNASSLKNRPYRIFFTYDDALKSLKPLEKNIPKSLKPLEKNDLYLYTFDYEYDLPSAAGSLYVLQGKINNIIKVLNKITNPEIED